MTTRIAWLASYPKSGNTWLRALEAALRTGEPPDINSLGNGFNQEGVELAAGISVSGLSTAAVRSVARASWLLTDSEQRVTVRKTHAAWTMAEDGFPTCWLPEGGRAIYVVRDPRDVALSWAHHLQADVPRTIEIMRSGLPLKMGRPDRRAEIVSWSEHVNSWTQQRDLPVLVLQYESMSQDPFASAREIADWLDIPADDDAVQQAVEACEFGRFVAQEVTQGFIEAANATTPFFRRGQAGAWRTELDPQLARQIEQDHGDVMRRFGYLD